MCEIHFSITANRGLVKSDYVYIKLSAFKLYVDDQSGKTYLRVSK